MRVVSLLASCTEIVCSLGFAGSLVGRSHECDFPEEVKQLPVCTEPKFNTEGTSYQIDQRVKAILQEGLSVYRVDAERLKQLQPDLILTQTQCEVCAVSLRDVERAVCDWLGSRPRIVALEPNKLADVWSDIERVAEALGHRQAGTELVRQLKQRMVDVSSRAARQQPRPSTACIEWIDPLMAAGNWMPELVEMAGGVNLFGEAGKHSPRMSWQQLRGADPDVIVILPCGWDIQHSLAEMPALARQPGWSELKAVGSRGVYLADGNQYFNRPGPRVVESLEILAEILHPDQFHFGHRGRGWQPWDHQE